MRRGMGPALALREMIPPITARMASGATLRAWDFKQKRALVIAFLHADCAACRAWLAQLASRAAVLAEHDAVALVIYSQTPPRDAEALPPEILTAADLTGNSQEAFLGRDAFSSAGLNRVGAFVADRYGELFAQWLSRDADGLPPTMEVFSALWQIQIQC